MNIAVIGSGNIGATLARKWAAAGHQILIGARDTSKADVQQVASEIGARLSSVEDAVHGADAVLFAIPGAAMAATLASLGTALDNKLVIDATNNIGVQPVNSIGTITSVAPGAAVYRAFNIYGFENFAEPTLDGVQADLFYAGTDGPAREKAEELIAAVGLRPVWLGGPERAELVDQFVRMWFTLAFEQKKGRRVAFKLLGV